MTDTMEYLHNAFDGQILEAGQAGYNEARSVWNAMIDRKPAIIARSLNSNDVTKAVSYAQSQDLPVSIRGGGHNVVGHAVCDDGVMIDLSQMRGVTVDTENRRASVEGGATWATINWTRDFWKRMQAHSDHGRIYLNFLSPDEEGKNC